MSIPSIIIILLLILLLALLLGGLLMLIYWNLVQRPTPRLNGTVRLPGLDQPVEVLRDKHGIPHIYAQTRTDLFHAQGYVHAQDRLWQMEQNRRIANGTLSELFGESALEADRFSRVVGFRRAAQAEAATLDGETRQVLSAYVAGVNAYIEAHAGRLAAEFNLLRFAPAPWQLEDVLALSKVTAWGQSVNWESELTRLQLLAKLGPMRAAELEPDYPHKNPLILEAVGSHAATRLLSTAGLLLNEYEKVKPWVGQPVEGVGSNSWVVAPRHSVTRRALLANDSHLAVQLPGIWYEIALHCLDFNVSGASLAGTPGVVIGHNEQIAWGLTNALVDLQDLYMEHPHPDDPSDQPTRFANGDAWEAATVVEETIYIRRRATPHVERVVITRHGPLISNLIADAAVPTMPLALRWVGHLPGQGARAVYKLNQARDWAEFQAALVDWGAPAQNITYADAEGNIGYVLAGMVPLRRHNLGLLPAPGWDGQHEWGGMVPPSELPRLYNPPSGKIVTANHKIVGDDYHHFLGVEFLPGWRAARLEEMLGEKERYSLRDMEEMQLDTVSKFAQLLAPYFAQLNSDDPFVTVALGSLRKWNYRMDADSTAAVVFHYALILLLDEIYGNKLEELRDDTLGISRSPLFLINGFSLRATTRLVELLRDEEQSVWYMDTQSGRQRSRDEVLYRALAEAVRRLRADLGDNARRWNWGRVHQVRYTHPLGSVRLFRSLFNRGPYPVGGDATTPNQTYYSPRLPLGLVQTSASYRQIYEVGVWDASESVIPTGQSGHPMAEHYADQVTMWLEGVYHAMPWTRTAVEQAARHRLQLRPSDKL